MGNQKSLDRQPRNSFIVLMLDPVRVFESLRTPLEKADQERRNHFERVKPFKIFFWICLIGALCVVGHDFYQGTEDEGTVGWSAGLLLLGLIVYGVKSTIESKRFKEYFQQNIVAQIVGFLGPDFSYDPQGYLPENQIKSSGFFKSFNKYRSEDLVKGKIGGRSITYAEIELIMESSSKSNQSGSRTQRNTIFDGIFLILELNATLPGAVWILPGTSISRYPNLNRDAGNIVALAHKVLQKKYTVFAQDPEFAKKLLHPAVIDHLMGINQSLLDQKITQDPAGFLFRENTICITLPLRSKFMEPVLSQPVNTREFIEKQLLVLNKIHQLAEMLK